MIDRQQAEVFLTLARELHFGRTAERLRLSTSRVSQTVRGLERGVGGPLFRRTSRRVELTALGAQLEDELRPAWEQVEGAWQRAVDVARGVSGSLRVAFVGPAAGQLMARAAERLGESSPGCEISLVEWSSFDVTSRLVAGDADLALTVSGSHEPGIRSGPVLVREAWVVAVPASHRLSQRAVVEPADLGSLIMLEVNGMPRVDRPDAAPGGAGRSAATLTEGLTLVGSGHGALAVGASVPRYHPRPDVAYVPMTGGPSLEWRLKWRAESTTAQLLAFAKAAQQVVS